MKRVQEIIPGLTENKCLLHLVNVVPYCIMGLVNVYQVENN